MILGAVPNFISTIVEAFKSMTLGIGSTATEFFDSLFVTAEGAISNFGIALLSMMAIGFAWMLVNFVIRLVRR